MNNFKAMHVAKHFSLVLVLPAVGVTLNIYEGKTIFHALVFTVVLNFHSAFVTLSVLYNIATCILYVWEAVEFNANKLSNESYNI